MRKVVANPGYERSLSVGSSLKWWGNIEANKKWKAASVTIALSRNDYKLA
jgi:hypothetical protein